MPVPMISFTIEDRNTWNYQPSTEFNSFMMNPRIHMRRGTRIVGKARQMVRDTMTIVRRPSCGSGLGITPGGGDIAGVNVAGAVVEVILPESPQHQCLHGLEKCLIKDLVVEQFRLNWRDASAHVTEH